MEHQARKIDGIKCEAEHCIYHTASNDCTAGTIEVENRNAKKEVETFCKTFESKKDCCN